VAICIVGFRNAEDIAACAEALGASTHRDFEIVICENGGAEAHQKLVSVLPRILPAGQPVHVHLAPGNLGYAGGVNLCMRASTGADAWWVLNPDTVPDPDALAELVAALESGEHDLVGGIVYDEGEAVGSYGGRWRKWLARAESIGQGKRLDDPIDEPAVARELGFISGCSMLVGRRFLETTGYMREDYFLYCEETGRHPCRRRKDRRLSRQSASRRQGRR
jgi:GT2 family glycosyltransferase